MNTKRGLGAFGEEQACLFLERRGFGIIARNGFTPYGEIDIIARESSCDQLVFVEVKTRINEKSPESAITRKKFRAMSRSAYFLMMKNNLITEDFRFDSISIRIFPQLGKISIRHTRALSF